MSSFRPTGSLCSSHLAAHMKNLVSPGACTLPPWSVFICSPRCGRSKGALPVFGFYSIVPHRKRVMGRKNGLKVRPGTFLMLLKTHWGRCTRSVKWGSIAHTKQETHLLWVTVLNTAELVYSFQRGFEQANARRKNAMDSHEDQELLLRVYASSIPLDGHLVC